jgi:hypothetical protein
VFLGLLLCLPLAVVYIRNGLSLDGDDNVQAHLSVTGLGLVIMGTQLFLSTLLFHGAVVATRQGRPRIGGGS